jgi:nucleoside phosphorylase
MRANRLLRTTICPKFPRLSTPKPYKELSTSKGAYRDYNLSREQVINLQAPAASRILEAFEAAKVVDPESISVGQVGDRKMA